MGSGQGKTKKKNNTTNRQNTQANKQSDNQKKIYGDDVIDSANLAIAIQREDFTTNYELFIHCEGLPKMDSFSLSDPMVVVYKDFEYENKHFINHSDQWLEQGKTEVMPECLNPKFVKTFILAYNYEKKQKLKFEVYDVDDFDLQDQLERQEIIGSVECDLHDIISSATQSISSKIINRKNKESSRKNNGILHIRAAEFDIGANKYFFRIGALGFASRGDLQVRFNYLTELKETIPIYATEPVRNQRKQLVQWNDFYLPFSKFSKDENAKLKLEVEEYNRTKGITVLGDVEITLSQMVESCNKGIRITKNGLQTGQIKLEVKQLTRYSFLNYIYSGAKLQLMVAIDFTKRFQQSSHHNLDENENDYVDAIKQVCGVMQYFNTDYKFLMYGFGARIPPYFNVVSHNFACSGNIFDPFVYGGVSELVRLYMETLKEVRLHGPTIFSQVIEEAINFASSEKIDQNNLKYYVLIIFTDGVLHDIDLTENLLLKAQDVAFSIVIVGIGKEDFTSLKRLDADDIKIQSKAPKEKIKRNIVQFLEYENHRDNLESLAYEVMSEVPKQFLAYMEENKIYPQKTKWNNKAASSEWVHTKIEEVRKLKRTDCVIGKVPHFLNQRKEDFIKQLLMLGYNEFYVKMIVDRGVQSMDINLMIELISQESLLNQNTPQFPVNKVNYRNDIDPKIVNKLKNDVSKIGHRVFRTEQRNKLDEMLKLKKQESHLITKQFLSNLQQHQVSSQKKLEPISEITISTQKHTSEKLQTYRNQQSSYQQAILTPQLNQFTLDENQCLECRSCCIQLIFLPCGHACSCIQCFINSSQQKCISCNQKILNYACIENK